MERAKQLGKIDARCILEPAGNLIDHAGRVTYELRGVAIAIHLNGVDSCQRLCDSLGDLRHDIDVAIGEKIGVLHTVVCFRLGLDAGGDTLAMCLFSGTVSLTLEARRLCLSLGLGRDAFSRLLGTIEIGVRLILGLDLCGQRMRFPSASMFLAALTSRSWCAPHAGQSHDRTDSGRASSLYPQAEQVLLDG